MLKPRLAMLSVFGLFGATLLACALGNLRLAPGWALVAFGLGAVSAVVGLATAASLPRERLVIALIVVHVAAVFGAPSLSDDIFRYVHEARASKMGLGVPYETPPNQVTPPPDDGTTAKVNHPEIPAAYPPFTQLLFFAVVTPSDAIGAPFFGLRLLFLLADLGVLLLLYFRGRHAMAFAWWGFHPLPILEFALGAHVDAVGVLLVVAAALVVTSTFARGFLVGLAIGVKPIAAAVFLGGPLRPKAIVVFGAGSSLAFGLFALPYVVTDTNIVKGLVEYSTRWQAQPTAYAAIEAPIAAVITPRNLAGKWAHLRVSATGISVDEAGVTRFKIGAPSSSARPLLLDARFFARAVAGALLLIIVGLLLLFIPSGVERIAFALLAFLLLTPTVHPWYWLWLLPFACSQRLIGIWGACLLAPLSYEAAMHFAATNDWTEAWWPRVLLLTLLVGGTIFDFRSRRRRDQHDAIDDVESDRTG